MLTLFAHWPLSNPATSNQLGQIEQIENLASYAPDHRAVKLKWNSPNNQRGQGSWKLNNSLLDDAGYVTLVGENILPLVKKILDKKIKGLNRN